MRMCRRIAIVSVLLAGTALSSGAAMDDAPTVTFDYWFEWHRTAYNEWLWTLRPGNTVPVLSPEGATVFLTEWRGEQMSLLTKRDDLDPRLVNGLMKALDAYWLACQSLCGNSPPPDADLGPVSNGRPLVLEQVGRAVEPPESRESLALMALEGRPAVIGEARAWGHAGSARSTINEPGLEELLRRQAVGPGRTPLGEALPLAIARNHVFFAEELGPLAPKGELSSALASLLAARACEKLGWAVPVERRSLEATLDRFEGDPSATFARTLAPNGDGGGFDRDELWLALLVRLQNASGRPDFVERLWKATAECPPATTIEDAIANLVVAASAASGSDLTSRFRAWRFPVSDATKARVRQALRPAAGT